MKIFFDTNVYVAEALLSVGAEGMIAATLAGAWRVHTSLYILDEFVRVIERMGHSAKLAQLSRQRILRRAHLVDVPETKHVVADDDADTPILRGAPVCSADYLVTNDRHLLALDPCEGVRIVALTQFRELLINEGLMAADS